MKIRLLIFGLLGPILSYLALLADSGDYRGLMAESIGFVLPLIFAIEIVPFLLCALVDRELALAVWWRRLGAVALAAFGLAFLVVLVGISSSAARDWPMLRFGLLAAAIPAVICSLLASAVSARGRVS